MKISFSVLICGLALACMPSRAGAAPVVFAFESGNDSNPANGDVYGSLDPQGFPELERHGFIVDVAATGIPTSALHFHEIDSTGTIEVPDRPFAERGVLFRDSVAGQDPVFFAAATPTFLFSLESLVVGASSANGSQTTTVRLSAFLAGSLLATVDLSTPTDAYTNYTGATFGLLDGLSMDKLEFTGLSNGSVSFYMLDNVAFQTIIPVPAALPLFFTAVMGLGLAGSGYRRKKSS